MTNNQVKKPRLNQYEKAGFVLIGVGLLVITLAVFVVLNFNPLQSLWDFFCWIFTQYTVSAALSFSAIIFFIFSVTLFQKSHSDREEKENKKIISRKEIFKIELPFTKIEKKKLEELRLELWKAYNNNAQNHTSHILTILVALVAFIAGWQSLSNSLIWGLVLFALSAGLTIMFVWLTLRSQYWASLSSQVVVLTYEDIANLFNRWNERKRHYQNYRPPLSAVMNYALQQKIFELNDYCSWIYNTRVKLVFKTSNM